MKISRGTRYLVLGGLFTFMGVVKSWAWFSGAANQLALWLGLLFCCAGPYFLFTGWRSRAGTGDSAGSGDARRPH